MGAWFPTANSFGPTDQRSKIGTFNIAPSWTICEYELRYLPWAHSCAATITTTTQAAILSRTSGRRACREVWVRTARSRTLDFGPISPTSKG